MGVTSPGAGADAGRGRVDLARALLRDAGIPPDLVEVADATDAASPTPSPGRWVIAVYPTTLLVGGVGQGLFKAYGQAADPHEAVALAMSLLSPSPTREFTLAEGDAMARGAAARDGIAARAVASGSGGPAAVPVGAALDAVGGESEHRVFAYGTPYAQRSQPPTDMDRGWRGYLLMRELTPECREGLAAPWFGQPGGGAMVVLDRPIRWYLDVGYFAPLSATRPATQ